MKYYVVLDLEMCKVPKGARGKNYNRANETIQIGAVLLNEDYQLIDEFNTYVRPQYGKLDSFISTFTGIGWKDLCGAPSFEEALEKFVDWIPEGDIEMVSWSDNDRNQLCGEMKYKGVSDQRMQELFINWIDSQVLYAEKVQNDRCYSLEEALIVCDIQTIGKAHDGFYDAYNTALLFKKMMTEHDLQTNQYYLAAKNDKETHLSCTLGDMFAELNWQSAVAG